MRKLEGKTALITGGGSGIGKAIAYIFADEGCQLVLASRNEERLRQAADEISEKTGASIATLAFDVSDPESVRGMFTAAMEIIGHLDILVNNSGAFGGAPLDEITDEQWQGVIGVNVNGVFYCTREAFRVMKPRGGGRIINIGSISAQRPREHSAAYTTSKNAVWGLTQSAALDGREYGIIVSCLHPGNTLVERRAELGGSSGTGLDLGPETMMDAADVGRVALLMVSMPSDVNMLEAIVLPVSQKYLGRG